MKTVHYTEVDWHITHIGKEVWYYSREAVRYDDHEGEPIIIPAFFLHNGGSIPWIFTAGLKTNGVMLSVYALHDYTYKKDFPYDITRKHADQLLYEYGTYVDYPCYKNQAVYSGVRIGGWRSWKRLKATYATD